jgi:polygalacturonase
VFSVNRPNHFITLKLLGFSTVQNLYIQNYPTHCFYISNNANLVIRNILLNNTAGNLPNAISNGLPAGHNTDGFGIASSTNITLMDSTVLNQDDCVAITSGDSITVKNMWCDGGHGLSIGSVGGKSSESLPFPLI